MEFLLCRYGSNSLGLGRPRTGYFTPVYADLSVGYERAAYQTSGKIQALVHVAFLAFLLFGGLPAGRFPIVAWLQTPCVLWAVRLSVVGWSCPLMSFGQDLLGRASAAVYSGEYQ